jgi:hypothetical protein
VLTGVAREEDVAGLLMDTPVCEEETLRILSSVERHVGKRSTM